MSNWKIITGGNTLDLTTNLHFHVQFSPGAGMPPLENLSTDFGLLDGAVFQRTRVPAREFQLLGYIAASTASALHVERRILINTLKPDRSASQEPVVIRYLGASDPIQASAYYNGGLELGRPTPAHELDMALSFLQVDPYWEAISSTSQSLITSSPITNANRILQRNASGMWTSLSSGMNNQVQTLTSDGSILIAGGNFSTAGGTAANRIATWNGTTWSALGAGVKGDATTASTGGIVYTVTVGADRSYYVGGDFSTAGSVSACRISKWNGSAWSACIGASGGTSIAVYTLITANDGAIFAGGQFDTMSGVAACNVARFGGTAWTALGAGAGIEIFGSTRGKDGSIYFVGSASTFGGSTACNIGRWDQSASTWYSVGSGLSGTTATRCAVTGNDGAIYVGDSLSVPPGTTASRVAKWNGNAWSALGNISPSTAQVNALALADDGTLYIGGFNMDTAGGITLVDNFVAWNGSNYIPPDVNLPGDATIRALHINNNVLTVGGTFSGTASAAAITSVNNTGTAATFPVMTACAPTSTSARLYQLVNYTANTGIYFNLALAPGEEVTLDLRPGKKTFTSNFRGNIIGSILPVSTLASWRLLPGANNVSFFMDSGSGNARLSWTNRYWGIDS